MTEEQRADRLRQNIANIEDLGKRLGSILAEKEPLNSDLAMPGADFFARTGMAYMQDMLSNPGKVFEDQVEYWGKSLQIWSGMPKTSEPGGETTGAEVKEKDRRFQHHHWHNNPYFAALRQQYDLNSAMLQKSFGDVEGVDTSDQRRLAFVVQQVIDMMCPANFLSTNPEAIEKALETDGQSLVDGLQNLVNDLERNNGELHVTLADPDAFQVGKDLAITKGSVVYRNDLIELIQYEPMTEKVKEVPLLIIPPWINKFYILDLKPGNSFIRWAVQQGYTVFVISWVNPDQSHRDVGMDTYMNEGPIKAITAMQDITGSEQVNVVGYCIGGTLLAMTLAYLGQTGKNPVRSATFLTTLLDFTDTGELDVFLKPDFINGIKEEADIKGFFPSLYMARAFSYMRANDLVYGPAIRSYLLGEKPPAFDLLYWNGDSTNLPARMATEYLEEICMANGLIAGTTKVNGCRLSLKDIRIPLIAVACESDHLVNWKSSYQGIQKIGSRSKRFILAESGHVAGVVNPPNKKKYGYYSNNRFPQDVDKWREDAMHTRASWWECWHQWQIRRSGKLQSPPPVGNKTYNAFQPAPGSYVNIRAVN